MMSDQPTLNQGFPVGNRIACLPHMALHAHGQAMRAIKALSRFARLVLSTFLTRANVRHKTRPRLLRR